MAAATSTISPGSGMPMFSMPADHQTDQKVHSDRWDRRQPVVHDFLFALPGTGG